MATKTTTITYQCGHTTRHAVSGYDGKDIARKAAWIGDYNECDNCQSMTIVPAYREWVSTKTGEVRQYVANLQALVPSAPGSAAAYIVTDGTMVAYGLTGEQETRLRLACAPASAEITPEVLG